MKKNKSDYVVLILISVYLLLPLCATLVYSISTEWMDVMP